MPHSICWGLGDKRLDDPMTGGQKEKVLECSIYECVRGCCFVAMKLSLGWDLYGVWAGQFPTDFSCSMSSEDEPVSPPQLEVKFSVIPETLESPFKEDFPAYGTGLVRGEPGGFVFHPHYAKNAEKIYRMNVRSDDVWIRTFPRSGTLFTLTLR